MAQRVLTLIRHENTLVGYSKVKSESRWKQTVSSAPQFVPFYHTSVGRLGLEAKKEENLADWYSQVSSNGTFQSHLDQLELKCPWPGRNSLSSRSSLKQR